MTAKQIASNLRMHAHALRTLSTQLEKSDGIPPEVLLKFTIQIIEQFANDKVAQASINVGKTILVVKRCAFWRIGQVRRPNSVWQTTV